MQAVAQRLSGVPFAPVVAGMFALAGAAIVLLTPGYALDDAVGSTNLPDMVAAFGPPLGMKAKVLLALASALVLGAVAFAVALPFRNMFDQPGLMHRRVRIRRADATTPPPLPTEPQVAEIAPNERRRRPIFAPDELGPPLMSDAALPKEPADSVWAMTAAAEAEAKADVQTATPVVTAPEVDVAGLTPVAPVGDADWSARSTHDDVADAAPLPIDSHEEPLELAHPAAEEAPPEWPLPKAGTADAMPDAEFPAQSSPDVAPPVAEPAAESTVPHSIDDLIARLESGMAKRGDGPDPGGPGTVVPTGPNPIDTKFDPESNRASGEDARLREQLRAAIGSVRGKTQR